MNTQRETYNGQCYRCVKRAADVLLAVVGLVILWPVMLLIAMLILVTDGRPVFYSQQREGYCGRQLRIWKFRSMRRNADTMIETLSPEQQLRYRQEFKISDDPRVTRLGRFLRRTSLDELPQLWNILTGDMSLIGPRPILPEELNFYLEESRSVLLSVRPGLTGYWQACSMPEDTYSTGRRQQMELYYAQHLSFSFDARIFFCTFATVIRKAFND